MTKNEKKDNDEWKTESRKDERRTVFEVTDSHPAFDCKSYRSEVDRSLS